MRMPSVLLQVRRRVELRARDELRAGGRGAQEGRRRDAAAVQRALPRRAGLRLQVSHLPPRSELPKHRSRLLPQQQIKKESSSQNPPNTETARNPLGMFPISLSSPAQQRRQDRWRRSAGRPLECQRAARTMLCVFVSIQKSNCAAATLL